MNQWLSAWIKTHYPACKDDLCYCFAKRYYSQKPSHCGFITKQNWMFDSRPKLFRKDLLEQNQICNLLQIGTGAFESIGGEVVKTSAFILASSTEAAVSSSFIDLDTGVSGSKDIRQRLLLCAEDPSSTYRHSLPSSELLQLPDCICAYWLGESAISLIINQRHLDTICSPRHGLVTGENDVFVRLWHEVSICRFSELSDVLPIWYPYCKGGSYRRWYGNREYCINWKDDGSAIRSHTDDQGKVISSNYNLEFNLKPNITWSDIRSNKLPFSARVTPAGSLFDTAGPSLFYENVDCRPFILGLLNSSVCNELLKISCRGLHYSPGAISRLPLVQDNGSVISPIVEQCTEIAKNDYDSQETSWDFKRNPLI